VAKSAAVDRRDIQVLSIAKGSCAEVRLQLHAALDIGYIAQLQFNELRQRAVEVSRVVNGLRASIEKRLETAK
jgi:four helix bundle protein